jgi:hypothetical protein
MHVRKGVFESTIGLLLDIAGTMLPSIDRHDDVYFHQ